MADTRKGHCSQRYQRPGQRPTNITPSGGHRVYPSTRNRRPASADNVRKAYGRAVRDVAPLHAYDGLSLAAPLAQAEASEQLRQTLAKRLPHSRRQEIKRYEVLRACGEYFAALERFYFGEAS